MSLFTFKAVLCQYCLFPLFPVKEVGGGRERKKRKPENAEDSSRDEQREASNVVTLSCHQGYRGTLGNF